MAILPMMAGGAAPPRRVVAVLALRIVMAASLFGGLLLPGARLGQPRGGRGPARLRSTAQRLVLLDARLGLHAPAQILQPPRRQRHDVVIGGVVDVGARRTRGLLGVRGCGPRHRVPPSEPLPPLPARPPLPLGPCGLGSCALAL
ncbi:hypothetical protein E2562_038632 [Oryza meyeriana var. granulata]|uniref:Uncharacterized protein n=1 Tax=Oryza meyeriana var. granulata TaxID=110450 RepID=A0A6G1CZI1_9ORYZ|nr:hypothetical protein E2562_038632 [Oryza meyeriana var. granulata]